MLLPSPLLPLSPSPQPFGDDHEKQYIYKEPAVTTLAEIVLRLQKLYSRKFGPGTPVNIVQESGRVRQKSNTTRLPHVDCSSPNRLT